MIRSLLIGIPMLIGTTLFAQPQYTIDGLIVSRNDSSAVAFASIYVDEQTGTVGNEDGYFKITSGKPIKTVTISHVNYETLQLDAGDHLKGVKKIYLVERSFQLREITVSGNTAETEIRLAVRNSSHAAMLPAIVNGYYSEFVKTNGAYEKFADGVIQYYIPKGYKDEKSIDAKVLASRAVDLKPDDDGTLDLASPVGVRFALRNYDISRVKKFLDTLSFEDYQYTILSGDDTDSDVIIRFAPKANREKALYEGEVHIDKAKHLIRSLDYKIAKETAAFIREVNAVLIKVKVLSAQGTILFDVQSDPPRYVPMFVREIFEIRMFNKKIDQTSVFTQQFQLLDAQPVLQSPLKRSEEYSKKALYHNGTQFTEKFWENANLVQATTDEQEIVKKVSNK